MNNIKTDEPRNAQNESVSPKYDSDLDLKKSIKYDMKHDLEKCENSNTNVLNENS